jgi:hypothetical protein
MATGPTHHLYAATPPRQLTTTPAYKRVLADELLGDEAKSKLYERWFRDAIAENPELVIEPCRECDLTDEDWYLWKTEFAVEDADGNTVGSIDVLLISSSGRIGIVETKLAYNPGSRRGVLAQVLDYAVHLPELPPDQMPPIPCNAQVSANDMAEHLARGDFLLIVAGDRLDPRAVKLSKAIVGDHMVNEWDLALVDVTLYKRTAGEGPTYLIVPNVRGMVITETRNVVRIAVSADSRSPQVKVERVPPPPASSGRQRWSEERFFAELAAASSVDVRFKELANRVHELAAKNRDRFTLSPGTGNTGSITLKQDDSGLIELYLDGTFRFRPNKIQRALGDRAQHYLGELRRLFPEPMKTEYPFVPATRAAATAPELVGIIERVTAAEEHKRA